MEQESQTKLIILNGFAGCGKTTIAKKFISEHPFVLDAEIDEIIVMLGQWLRYEDKARVYAFEIMKNMISTHLNNGKSVIVPYLLLDSKHAEEFENIAIQNKAAFYEIYLSVDKEKAVSRLMSRGTWGEAGSPPITKEDLPHINEVYDLMSKETVKRTGTISISSDENKIEDTYDLFLKAIGER